MRKTIRRLAGVGCAKPKALHTQDVATVLAVKGFGGGIGSI